jgi:hypothetical protein
MHHTQMQMPANVVKSVKRLNLLFKSFTTYKGYLCTLTILYYELDITDHCRIV